MAHFIRDDEKEKDIGFIYRVSGPLVIAEGMSGAVIFPWPFGRINPGLSHANPLFI